MGKFLKKPQKVIAIKKINLKSLKIVFILIILMCSMIFIYKFTTKKYREQAIHVEITAHRGASAYYPENTMSAFEGAKKLNADWIELDVQQTKDGKIIVMHDTNFNRTAGVDKNIWELTYDEVSELDVGSYFSKDFEDERIPLLEEVIDYAKNSDVKLSIELKSTGHEIDFEKTVIGIIKYYNFENNCVISSQNYSSLENLKKYDKNISTVYIIDSDYDDITELIYADGFSIKASSINEDLVKKIHKEGKRVYVWTVNTKDSIIKMIELNVDNIITDDITLVKETIARLFC